MALIKCSGCEKDVSTYDKACGNCGAVIQAPVGTGDGAVMGGLLKVTGVALVLAAGGWWFFDHNQKSSDADFIALHQNRIKENFSFKDPESLQFTGVFISRIQRDAVVCGYVNAKNGFGAYTGRTRFISGGSTKLLESSEGYGFDGAWSAACG